MPSALLNRAEQAGISEEKDELSFCITPHLHLGMSLSSLRCLSSLSFDSDALSSKPSSLQPPREVSVPQISGTERWRKGSETVSAV